MDLNKLVARAKAMLLTPKTEWPVVATEPTTVAELYKGYIVPLAAIPAIFGFLKMSVIGTSVMFAGTFRVAVGPGRQTARLLRPLRRRADRIERPARVRMRRRKPCTL